MKIEALGHVVIRVTDRARAEAFFTLGDHHDFAVSEVPSDPGGALRGGPGLDHVAFRIGHSLDQLRAAKAKLDAAGIETTPIDHEVTKSLYLHDPDGNGVELYVDVSDAWRADPQRVAQAAPLVL